MMKFHKPSRARMLAGAAAIATLGGLSLAAGSPGLAQQADEAPPPRQEQARPDEERREERVIVRTIREHGDGGSAHRTHSSRTGHSGSGDNPRVIVMTHRGGGHGDHPGHGDAARHVRVIGPDGEISVPDCQGGDRFDNEDNRDGQHTRVVLCSRGDGNAAPAQRAERLQRARDRLAGDSELSAEQKAHITAALDREIARLRGN